MKIRHLHARTTEAIFFRLSREFILVLHLQHGSGLHPNYRRRITPSIAKFGFARDWIRYRYERDCELAWGGSGSMRSCPLAVVISNPMLASQLNVSASF